MNDQVAIANNRYKYTTDGLHHPSDLNSEKYFLQSIDLMMLTSCVNFMVSYYKLYNVTIATIITREKISKI